ncbi:MAG: site-specific integrase [Planctomycetota bacterium]
MERLKAGDGAYVDPEARSVIQRWAGRWAGRMLSSIAPHEIRAYFEELSRERLSPKSIEREKLLLRFFFRWALRSGWVDADPTEGLFERAPRSERAPVAWEPWEQRLLLDACQGRLREAPGAGADAAERSARTRAPQVPRYLHPLVLLGLRTGLGLEDLLRLRWRHVFLDARRIRLPAAERAVPRDLEIFLDGELTAILEAVLQASAEGFSPEKFLLESLDLPLWREKPDSREILCAFRAVRRRAGVRDGDFASLRATFVANCVRAGVPAEEAARLCDADPEPRA